MSRRTRSEWFKGSSLFGNRRHREQAPLRSTSRRLRVEPLEDRRLLAVVTVTSTSAWINGDTTSIAALLATPGDDGISLVEAVTAANNTVGKDTIQLASHLANQSINTTNLTITDDVIIHGQQAGPAILQGPAIFLQQYTGAGRILDVAANVNATIDGFWFQNGDAVDPLDGSTPFGGAIRNAGNLTLRDCTFYDNYAGHLDSGIGGGAAIANTGTLNVIDCSFAANMAVYGSGGAIYNAGTATVTNSTFANNWAGYAGGAMYNAVGGALTVTNCTMVDNGSNGDPILVQPVGHGTITNDGMLVLRNTVIVGTTHGGDVENNGTLTGSHNFIAGGSSLPNTLSGNPLLQPIAYVAGRYFLPQSQDGARPFTVAPLAGSPLIDAGNNAAVSVTDQIGAPRINNGTVDIGAIEAEIAPTTIVVTTLTDEDDGTIDPAVGAGTSLREALSVKLKRQSTITFAPGLSGTIAIATPLVINDFSGLNGPTTRGMVAIVGPGADVLTIDGQGVGPTGGGGILWMDRMVVAISGLTFANGTAVNGGAIYGGNLTATGCAFVDNTAHDGSAVASDGTFVDCLFARNKAVVTSSRFGGGAIYSTRLLNVDNCTFVDNSASGRGEGGAIHFLQIATITNSTFTGNSAFYGGAIASRYSDDFFPSRLFLSNCTFTSNSAEYGGALYCRVSQTPAFTSGEAWVFNCTFVGNTASIRGGAIYNSTRLTVINSTLTANSSASGGGGIDNGAIYTTDPLPFPVNPSPVTLYNTIVAGSIGGADVAVGADYGGPLLGSHNFIGDGSGGLPNTITGDPLLGPLADNGGPTQTRAPLAGSPVLDAGINTVFPQPPAAPSGIDVTNYAANGVLPDNTTYTYRVSAYNGAGETFSQAVSVTTGSTGSQANAVSFSWNQVPEAWIYVIYRRSPDGVEERVGEEFENIQLPRSFVDYGRQVLAPLLPSVLEYDQRGEPFDRVVRGTPGVVSDVVGLSEIWFGTTSGPIRSASNVFASSYYDGIHSPFNMIDGSGLDMSSGNVLVFTHAPHPSAVGMWAAGVGQGVPGDALVNEQYVVFDLEGNFDLSDVYLWQMVQDNLLARGIKEFRLLASPNASNPADFANPPANFNLTGFTEILGVTELAIGKAGQNATTQQFALTGATNVRTIYLDVISSYNTAARVDIGAVEYRAAPAEYYGDYNRDGAVDAADYTVWRNWFGATGVIPFSGADGDGNGRIERADYAIWKSHFGELVPIQAAGGGSIALSSAGPAAVVQSATKQTIAPASTELLETGTLTPSKLAPGLDWAVLNAQSPQRESSNVQRRFGNHLEAARSVDDQLLLLLAGDRAARQSQAELPATIETSDEAGANDDSNGLNSLHELW